MRKARILIVEDESIIAMELESILTSFSYEVTSIVDTAENALAKAEVDKPDIILMDIRIKGEQDGISAAQAIRTLLDIPVVFTTAYLDEERIGRAKITMPFGYVLKPIQERDLKVTVEMALYAAEMDRARKKAEKKLQESEEKYRIAFETNSDSVTITQMNGIYVDVNPGFTDLTGYTREEVIGKSALDIDIWVKSEDRENLVSALNQKGFAKKLRATFRCKDGSFVFAMVSASIIELNNEPHILLFTKNITERVMAAKKQQQLQKSETVSILAGGITHSFNNILASIMGNAEFALRHELKEGEPGTYSVQQIVKATHRARFLTKQLLTLSRRRKVAFSNINLGPIVKEVTKFLKATLPGDITVQLSLAVGTDIVMADPVLVFQVLMDICSLAVEAMDGKGGALEIGLTDPAVSSAEETGETVDAPGPFIEISVTNNSQLNAFAEAEPPASLHLDANPQSRINRTSTLNAIRQSVAELHGELLASYEPGKGNRLVVRFPSHEMKEEGLKGINQPIPGGKERILFVDDDEQIVEFAERSLETVGYTVTGICDSEEAYEVFYKSPDQFDLIISDLNMEGLSGDQLVEKIRKIRPDTPIIFCTGHDEMMTGMDGENPESHAVIMKPFLMDEMDALIRQVLHNEDSRTVGDKSR